MFRILVVDDDPAARYLLQNLTKNLQRPHELHVVKDGLDALDFLHHRGVYRDVSLPNLILLCAAAMKPWRIVMYKNPQTSTAR